MAKDDQEYLVTQWLPDNGQIVLCFGHKTFCCKCDMDEEPARHKVRFILEVNEYRLKKEIPTDPEESILDYYRCVECWYVIESMEDGTKEHVIGVTKWKKLND